jgi:hypothetical protein
VSHRFRQRARSRFDATLGDEVLWAIRPSLNECVKPPAGLNGHEDGLIRIARWWSLE